MNNSPKIGIVILNYNGANDTIECIKSLSNVNYDNYKMIIVDNSSTDNSISEIKKSLNEKCVFIESPDNDGFASGNNIGIKKALDLGSDIILLINNDTLVDKEFINEMLKCFNMYDNIGIVSCKILYYPDKKKIWYGGGIFDKRKFLASHEHYACNDDFDDNIREVNFITGCCMMIPREIFEDVGLLPEEYFMYFEDVDFCINVLNHGYKLIYNPNGKIYHKVSASVGGENTAFSLKFGMRNRFILINKYKNIVSLKEYFILKIFFYLSYVKQILKCIFRGNISSINSLKKGLKEAKYHVKAIKVDKF